MAFNLGLGLALGGSAGVVAPSGPTFSLNTATGIIEAYDNGYVGPANLSLTSTTYPAWNGTYALVWPITTPQVLFAPVIAGAAGASNPPVPGDVIEVTVPALTLADSVSYQWMVDGVASGSAIDGAAISVGSLPQFTAVAGDIRLDVTATIGAETVTVSSNTITVTAIVTNLLIPADNVAHAAFDFDGPDKLIMTANVPNPSTNRHVLLLTATSAAGAHVLSGCEIGGVSAPLAMGTSFWSNGNFIVLQAFLANVPTGTALPVVIDSSDAGTTVLHALVCYSDRPITDVGTQPGSIVGSYGNGVNSFDQNVLDGDAVVLMGHALNGTASLSGATEVFSATSGVDTTKIGIENITADESPRALSVEFTGTNRRCGGSLVFREVS